MNGGARPLSALWRWLAPCAVGLVLLAADLSQQAGDLLLANGQPAEAARFLVVLPIAARLSLTGDARIDGEDAGTLAARALQVTSLVPAAITQIAMDRAAVGDHAGSRTLLEAAASLGWRDEYTQRQLYNSALRQGHCDAAMQRAAALLRQGKAIDALGRRLVDAAAIAPCRIAIARLIARNEPWARSWLSQWGTSLDPTALATFARAGTTVAIGRDTWAPVIGELVAGGRVAAAAGVWRAITRPAPLSPGLVPWVENEQTLLPTPFDWHFSSPVTSEAPPGTLRLQASADMFEARRLLDLSPGSYQLVVAGPVAADAGWDWGVSCEAAPVSRVSATLTTHQPLNIPQGCNAPWLFLTANTPPLWKAQPLPQLRILPLTPEPGR